MTPLGNQSGTSVVESALILAVLAPLLIMGLGISMASGLKSLGHHALYESLICMAEGHIASHCEKKMKGQLERFFKWGHFEQIRLNRGPYTIRGQMIWHLGPRIRIKIQHQIPRRLEKAS
ncbi:MAG: hypothetical protein KDD43_02760 [Bdellovibrionales bacterium]|nr:hypothetical protein [Bdellovibrionales bacterium]